MIKICNFVNVVILDSKGTSWRSRKNVYLPCSLTSTTNGPMELEIEQFMEINYKHFFNLRIKYGIQMKIY
jgi:hypothetical protein